MPLEADLLHGVAFLDEIRSESISGLSSIVLIFEPGTDIYRARQVVAERLTQAHALPNVAKAPVMVQPLSSLSRFMVIGMRSDEKSLIDMSVLARWNIRPRLIGVAGCRQRLDLRRARAPDPGRGRPHPTEPEWHLARALVKTAGNALWFSPLTFLEASTPGTGGFIETPQQRIGIQHILPIRTAEDLAKVAIEPEDGAAPLRIGDVARVVEDHQPLIGDGLVGDGTRPAPRDREVPRRQHARGDPRCRGRDGGAPAGPAGHRDRHDASIARRRSSMPRSATSRWRCSSASCSSRSCSARLLFDWRAALISLVTIPLSVAAAAIVLHLAGASINAMTLAGLLIAIAVIIDEAAGVVDGRRDALPVPGRGRCDRERRPQIVTSAVVEGRGPIVYGTLIILVALVPLLFVAGGLSAFLPSLAVAYGVAILAAMIVSLTVAPALAVLLLGRGPARRESPVLRRMRGWYQGTLSGFAARIRPTAIVAGLALVVVAMVVVRRACCPPATRPCRRSASASCSSIGTGLRARAVRR